ncbi:TIGR02444 family protein [Brevundimonas sp.]|uniref:TIGR02444 family protein n=1 Tax=Brevundimonas sp. TaxID=1871086 RepID=UPI00289F5FD0|nr:TIGR02444 family protein [Brevundimonas sp.]
MGLWDWAVAAYGAPGVSDACLALQDHHEQNVPLLLWSAWAAATGRRPDEETIEAACDTARAWDGVVVTPLRAMRRILKAPVPDIDDGPRETIRNRVKALELEAERHLLQALEALAPEPIAPPRPAIEGLAATARVWAAVTPRPALIRLADALPA